MDPRFARHLSLNEIGATGQERLADATVLLVGMGGLGCPAALYLANSGVGNLLLNDFDRVDESNLPRQILFGSGDIGQLKVDVARARLQAEMPALNVETIPRRLAAAELQTLCARADVVLDGTDNFATRLLVNRGCVRSGTPLVSGAAVRFEGQLAVFSNAGGGPCYRCLYDDEDEWLGNCQGTGVATPVTGVMGTLMAVEALKVLLDLGEPVHRLRLWDATTADWTVLNIKPRPGCPECGGGPEQLA